MTDAKPLPRLTCCGAIYSHKADCVNHRHQPNGNPACMTCRAMDRPR